ncbi:MAG: hypothetical protein AB7R89_07275 [Dehalococcoidia bacterium]
MPLPRLGQYQLALQHPATAFADPDLRAATVETTPMGLPRVISGGFALTYHLKNGRHEWAVRCFHREASELGRRYQAISSMIVGSQPGPFVTAAYIDRGVQVDGVWYPVTKMPWLQAVPINRYIETNLDRHSLSRLVQRFRTLAERLDALGVAHGDLQHGNILVDPFGNLTLVDYDGMFVPALGGLPSNESGHVNYQHPRRGAQFDHLLDRFAVAVIYTSLSGLAADPALWHRYSNGENLLFKRADFDDPGHSPLFTDLHSIATVAPLAGRLAALCRSDYATLPMLDEFIEGPPRVTPKAAPSVPAPSVRSQFDVIDARDTERLLHHEGDIVTVVGRITATRQRWSRQRRPYVVVNVSSDKTNGLTLELWSQALNFFMPAGQVITAYTGTCVRATGLIAISHRRDAARTPRPVMTISLPSDIHVISEDEAVAALNTREAVPWYRVNRRPRPAPPQPVSGQAAATLNRLYGIPPPDRIPRAMPSKKRPKRQVKQPSTEGTSPSVKRANGPTAEVDTWWRALLPENVRSRAARARSLTAAVAQLLKTTIALVAFEMMALLLVIRLLG